jgi:hypothetical protein
MIKFFRKIRQNLLMENKTGKYFKYAIGEIILVVIGILIALQINNWNESRKLQENVNTYLNQKLVNLREDQLRLVELKEFRLDAAEKSKQLLNIGLNEANVFNIIKTTKLIFTERRFTTSVERNESSITKYYWSKKEAVINNFEQEYMSLIELIKFEENRLNTFSEAIELDLWRQGYLTDNRKLYNSMITDLKPSEFGDDNIPILILDEDNGQKSLEGLLHRNEIANPSIALKLNNLLKTNKRMIKAIEDYLN